MSTTAKIVDYFANTKAELFTLKDIIDYTGLRYTQVYSVINFWRVWGKVEWYREIRDRHGRRKQRIYRLKTAGKKYINKKANRLVYVIDIDERGITGLT
jgi:hypothetical protein